MTIPREPHIIRDQLGNPVAVVLDIASYEALLDMYEDAEDIRLSDEAKMDEPVGLPFAEAVKEIERMAAEYHR